MLFGMSPLILAIHAIVLLTVIPVHEFAHGYIAYRLGDDTARQRGRLTLNPLVHVDLFGTISMLLLGFGWAKPVPVNPGRFKNPRWGLVLSSLAGPIANILLALIALVVYKCLWATGFFYTGRISAFTQAVDTILYTMIIISLQLAVFNLFPIPPLDGFKIFGALLPKRIYFFILQHEVYVFLALIVLIMATDVVSAPIYWGASYLLRFLNFITSPIDMLLF